MNLNENPTTEQLKEIVASSDHRLGHHVLWVGTDGMLHLAGPFDCDARVRWLTEHREERAFRFETMTIDSDDVGPDAASDDGYVGRLFNGLVDTWKRWLNNPRKDQYVECY
jgi:hypothetical protein